MQSITQARPEVQSQMVSGNVPESDAISTRKKTVKDAHSARMRGKEGQRREELLCGSRVAESKPYPPTKKNRVLFHPAQTTSQQIVQAFGNRCILLCTNRFRVSSF